MDSIFIPSYLSFWPLCYLQDMSGQVATVYGRPAHVPDEPTIRDKTEPLSTANGLWPKSTIMKEGKVLRVLPSGRWVPRDDSTGRKTGRQCCNSLGTAFIGYNTTYWSFFFFTVYLEMWLRLRSWVFITLTFHIFVFYIFIPENYEATFLIIFFHVSPTHRIHNLLTTLSQGIFTVCPVGSNIGR